MVAKKNPGKVFEANFQSSVEAVDEKIFFDRIKDLNLPISIRSQVKLSPNKYDCYMFARQHLFALELKSTQSKSLSLAESSVKQHQIDNLLEASTYPYVIAGFLINFREPENVVYFIPIDKFVEYQNIAQNGIKEHSYTSKVNKSSIPIGICKEIGIEIGCYKKKVNYHYHIKQFVTDAIKQYVYKYK